MEFPVTSDVSSFDYSVQVLKRLQGVSFAYLNICSVVRKFDDVRLLLERSDLDFLALGETFLNESISTLNYIYLAIVFIDLIEP